ncbi:hypothetical protein [Denitrovibrio acetiphilus]|nr:hypothetical protein [Denitrovibrio acetiphilus]
MLNTRIYKFVVTARTYAKYVTAKPAGLWQFLDSLVNPEIT